MLKKVTTALLLTILIIILPGLVSAQSGTQILLGAPNLEEFPYITTFMEIRDAQGYFVSSLSVDDVSILEDGQQLFAAEVVELRPGAQIVVAVNPGSALAIRDTQGQTRFDYLSQALSAWAVGLGESDLDTLSLVVQNETLTSHVNSPNTWLSAWQSYQPDLETSLPSPEVLSQAITLAADPTPNSGMGRAVFFITPAMSIEAGGVLQSLADQASQANIRIYVAMVDSPSFLESQQADQLRALASQTGGQFFAFSGSEPIPDIDVMLESARRIYQVGYNSHITSGGLHEFGVVVQTPQGSASSETKSFEMALRAPNPIFVSPPNQILRAIPENTEIAVENLQPSEYNFDIVIDYPDTIQREIVRTALYVNGEFVAENNAPPFESFTLDLTQFEASELLMLKAEATDD